MRQWDAAPAERGAGGMVEVGGGFHVGALRALDQRIQNRCGLGPALRARSEVVDAPDDEPQLILPISRFAPASTIDGIPRTTRRPMFSTKSSAAVKRCMSACALMTRA